VKQEFYWIVMLLAHSGCRATEVLQLLKSDIQQQDGIWLMNISGKGPGQQLKNKASVRVVPIHSTVLKLASWIIIRVRQTLDCSRSYSRMELWNCRWTSRGSWSRQSWSVHRWRCTVSDIPWRSS